MSNVLEFKRNDSTDVDALIKENQMRMFPLSSHETIRRQHRFYQSTKYVNDAVNKSSINGKFIIKTSNSSRHNNKTYNISNESGDNRMDEATKMILERLERDSREREERYHADAAEREKRYREEMLEQDRRNRQEAKEREERILNSILEMKQDIKSDFNEVKSDVRASRNTLITLAVATILGVAAMVVTVMLTQ